MALTRFTDLMAGQESSRKMNAKLMRKLLVLTDFSNVGNNAANYGYDLATALNVDVTLCNVIDFPDQYVEGHDLVWPPDDYQGLIDESKRELERVHEGFALAPPKIGFQPNVICDSLTGRFVDQVLAVETSIKPEMIVMGMHDKNGNLLMGNNARNIINATCCPLLLVPTNVMFSKPNNIAFAISMEYPDRDFKQIFKLSSFVELFSATIFIAHVDHGHKSGSDRRKKKDEFSEIMLSAPNYREIHYRLINNHNIVEGLGLFCKDEKIDLLVMIHRPYDFLDSILRVSYTQKMASSIDIPLLILPDAGFG